MSDLYDDEQHEQPTPEGICRQAFSRCSNWPTDFAGQQGLYRGLSQACVQFRISQEDLIDRCREISPFCPTDADLFRVAGEMFSARQAAAEASRDQRKEWERQYGKPQPFGMDGKCTCCGREWKEILKTSDDRKQAMWNGLREHFHVKKGKWPSYQDMAPVARALGFEDYARAWERS